MKKSNVAKSVGAILIAGVLTAGVCCMGFASRGENGKWFGNSDIKSWHWKDKAEAGMPNAGTPEAPHVEGGGLVNVVEESGVSLISEVIPYSEYAENGISPQAENAYTLTATIAPECADDKTVDWSVEWVNSSIEWASGKTVTDYVTVTPTQDGALTANVECVRDFGAQILVKCTSRNNPDAYAVCTVDYEKRLLNFTLKFRDNSGVGHEVSDNSEYVFNYSARRIYIPSDWGYVSLNRCDIVYSNYTVDNIGEIGAVLYHVEGSSAIEGLLDSEGIVTNYKSYWGGFKFSNENQLGDNGYSNRSILCNKMSLFTGNSSVPSLFGVPENKFYDACMILKSSKVLLSNPAITLTVSFGTDWEDSNSAVTGSYEIQVYFSQDGFAIPVESVGVDNSAITF